MLRNKVFKEEQKFNQLLLWIVLIGLFIVSVIALIQNIKVSEANLDFNSKTIGLLISSFVFLALIIFFRMIKLCTEINEEGIKYQFYPIHLSPTIIKWPEIKSIKVRQYSALKEFGGWGIRFSLKGSAYNIGGNMGIELNANIHGNILIGTQKANEATEVIDYYYNKAD